MSWLAAVPALLGGLGSAAAATAPLFTGGQGNVSTERVPQIGQIRAIQQLLPRLLLQNLTGTPGSFSEFLAGGGTQGRNFTPSDILLTPQQARLLDYVGPQGEPIPYTTPTGGTIEGAGLDPQQLLFVGRLDASKGRNTRPAHIFKTQQKVARLTNKLEDRAAKTDIPRNPRKQMRFERKTARLQARLTANEDLLTRLFQRSENTAGVPLNPSAQHPYLNQGVV